MWRRRDTRNWFILQSLGLFNNSFRKGSRHRNGLYRSPNSNGAKVVFSSNGGLWIPELQREVNCTDNQSTSAWKKGEKGIDE